MRYELLSVVLLLLFTVIYSVVLCGVVYVAGVDLTVTLYRNVVCLAAGLTPVISGFTAIPIAWRAVDREWLGRCK